MLTSKLTKEEPLTSVFTETDSPVLLERIAALYAIDAEIRGQPAEYRQQIRHSRPLVDAMHVWLRALLDRLSGRAALARLGRGPGLAGLGMRRIWGQSGAEGRRPTPFV